MPLSPELDQKIRNRFDELIEEGTELVAIMKLRVSDEYYLPSRPELIPICVSQYNSLAVKSRNLVRMVFGDLAEGKAYQRRIDGMEPCTMSAEAVVGDLTGLRSDYTNGFLDDLQERVVSDISADYMGQAEALLGEGIPGQYDHVPAAVLCGAVLEDSLRRLCQRQSPPISTDQPNGKPKTLDPLITDLQKASVYKKTKAAQLRSWAQIRNSAAHGKFSEFDRNDVESMLKGVTNFLADYL